MQKPLLIDLDGVLRIGTEPAVDLPDFLAFLEENSIPSCILSNSSISSSSQIYHYFNSHSIKVDLPIITAIDSAYNYIQARYEKVAVYTSENVIDLFAEFLDYEHPDAVLIGDIGNLWNYQLMQKIYEYIRAGAELIAAHKNKYWQKPGVGIQLDAGPFIHAIEYATSTSATLIGKPSRLYFQSALKKIDFDINDSFIMLGDDLDTDMAGAKKLGAETILIYTGKTELPISENESNFVDHEANNLIEVIEQINRINSKG